MYNGCPAAHLSLQAPVDPKAYGISNELQQFVRNLSYSTFRQVWAMDAEPCKSDFE
jgi:hypothetical protein